MAPLAGYNPTYGFFAGGGYFRKLLEEKEESVQWSLVAVIAQKRTAAKTEFRMDARLPDGWKVEGRNELANGFESNFGLGSETRVEHRVDVPFWKDELDLYFYHSLTPQFSLGPGIEHRIRRNQPFYEPSDGLRQKDPLDDREATAALVFLERFDFRDIPENPRLGWKQEAHLSLQQPYWGGNRRASVVLDTNISLFHYLFEHDLVLAYSLAGGWAWGEPTYLNQFRLGGTDRLRGYYYDRFRGTRYYLEQTELRFPLWGQQIGAVVLLDVGGVSLGAFQRARFSYGGGLRIGLPPDHVSKLRVDFAIGDDQRGLFVDFGQAF